MILINQIGGNFDKIQSEHLKGVKNYINLSKLDDSNRAQLRIKQFLIRNLDNIILLRSDELLKLHNEYSEILKNSSENDRDLVNENISSIFDYTNWSKKHSVKYCAYDLAKKLHIPVCPYCNRSYTTTVCHADEQLTRPEFDHFFDKATHPILSLSFYNLIPSCHICNSTLKGSTNFDCQYLNPYEGEFGDDAVFVPNVKSINELYANNNNLEIDFSVNKDSSNYNKIMNNISVFRLKEIYTEAHGDVFAEICEKADMYSEQCIKSMVKSLDNPEITEAKVYNILFGNHYYKEDFIKRPLSKYTYDILKYLGCLKRIENIFNILLTER